MRSSRLSASAASVAPLASPSLRAIPASATADVLTGSGRPQFLLDDNPHLQHADATQISVVADRRHGGDRRSQSRREERQNVWLDTRSGQDRRRQNRRAGDSISTVSLKI